MPSGSLEPVPLKEQTRSVQLFVKLAVGDWLGVGATVTDCVVDVGGAVVVGDGEGDRVGAGRGIGPARRSTPVPVPPSPNCQA